MNEPQFYTLFQFLSLGYVLFGQKMPPALDSMYASLLFTIFRFYTLCHLLHCKYTYFSKSDNIYLHSK